MTAEHFTPAQIRRIHRLADELADECVPLPRDDFLLAEIAHARRPPVHEGRVGTYGAVVADHDTDLAACIASPHRIPLGEVDIAAARRYADGRASFVEVGPDGPKGLLLFEASVETEASAVRVQRSLDAAIVQRTRQDSVRVVTADGVVLWDGIRWTYKPHARHHAKRLAAETGGDGDVAAALLDLAVHWLSAGHVGATLVWYLDDDGDLGSWLDRTTSRLAPTLDVTRASHLGAIRSSLAQHDLATVFGPRGDLRLVGATLVHSRDAGDTIAAFPGARHTSARRFSADEHRAVVIVVSQDGPVTVFHKGQVDALLTDSPCHG